MKNNIIKNIWQGAPYIQLPESINECNDLYGKTLQAYHKTCDKVQRKDACKRQFDSNSVFFFFFSFCFFFSDRCVFAENFVKEIKYVERYFQYP